MSKQKNNNNTNNNMYFRNKVMSDIWSLTFDDVLCVPSFTNFEPSSVDISTKIGPYKFKIPIITASMDTVTEAEMAIQMALLGGLGVLHRNCSFQKQLQMVKKVKRARAFIIQDVATVKPDDEFNVLKQKQKLGFTGMVVVDDINKVVGIATARDMPFDNNYQGFVKDIMTKDPVCAKEGISREEAMDLLYKIRKEKLPIVNSKGELVGLITRKDLKPEFPNASKDEKGKLLCALGISPFLPKSPMELKIFKEIDKYTDIFMTDVAEVFKDIDLKGIHDIMNNTNTPIVIGNIGTFEAAEHIITKGDYPDDKLIGLKVGMGSGSICITSQQTGVGAPTLSATAEVADAIKAYNPNLSLIADGGFKHPGDLTKAFSVGCNAIMTGHFFAGCTESPGFMDTIGGRKVKVYRGMGSAEARAIGDFNLDRYVKESKKLPEGVSDYIPFVGPVQGVVDQLCEGLKNGMIYCGAQNLEKAKQIRLKKVTLVGQIEGGPHDLISRK
ncbi:MAG: IMP dehydrogenase [archaeon]|nr:IMP dehydrogenase [archaeon]